MSVRDTMRGQGIAEHSASVTDWVTIRDVWVLVVFGFTYV